MMNRHFFRKFSPNREYIQTLCNNINNSFHFACRQWHLHNIAQCGYSINTGIQIQIMV